MLESPRDIWEKVGEPQPEWVSNFAAPVEGESKPFTVLSGAELRKAEVPPKTNILGEGVIALGQLTTVVGQGGTGKSRVTMQIAIHQVLGKNFGGLPTHKEPLRHLLIGTENSIYRQKSDYVRMTSALNAEERELVDSHIYFHVVKEIDDSFINLGSEEIKKKWRDTLEAILPKCIYVDPFGEVNVGDINKDADVRHTLRELTKICRRHSHDTAIIVVHHGRTGRQNIAQAVGWDKGNFALGSKALYSGARSQINIAPADPEDHSKIVISCGKSNDAKPFDPVGLKLDEETMLYHVDDAFDLNSWKDDVEGKSSGQSASIKDVIEAIREGHTTHKAICDYVMQQAECSQKTARRRITDGIDKGYFRKKEDGRYFLTQKSLST